MTNREYKIHITLIEQSNINPRCYIYNMMHTEKKKKKKGERRYKPRTKIRKRELVKKQKKKL